MPTERKDIMAPDNKPTAEELALVMHEARDEAMRKHAIADAARADPPRRGGSAQKKRRAVRSPQGAVSYCGGKPRLLVVARAHGSGKTTVTERDLRHEWLSGCEYIKPDNIARDVFGKSQFTCHSG